MIHPKTPSPLYNRQRSKRQTNSGRNVLQSAKTVQLDEKTHPKVQTDATEKDIQDLFELLDEENKTAEMAKILDKKTSYLIAPDALIPNSTLRSMFKIKDIQPLPSKAFQLRLSLKMISSSTTKTNEDASEDRLNRYAVVTNLDGIHTTILSLLMKIDILANLQNKTNKNLDWQNDDDEWVELEDPDIEVRAGSPKPPSAKKARNVRPATGTLISHQKLDDDFDIDDEYNIYWDKETIPPLFQNMKKEPWWQLPDDAANNNLRSMLLYLIQIITAKQSDSYESACHYVVEIFRAHGIEPSLLNQILSVLTFHVSDGENDPLNIHTVRAIARFMMERKDIIIPLLELAVRCSPENDLRQETINSIKYIAEVNSSDDIDLVLNNMQIARDAADDTFSLKTIIDRIKYKLTKTPSNINADEPADSEEAPADGLHPLLKKISEERWYSRDDTPVTMDSIIDVILVKLPNASKTMLKTLTAHMIQMHRVIGYSKEQYDRVANGVILLLSHNDPDHRLIAATTLAELGKETKATDIALLNSFINDPRVLVRTECCDTLKKLTLITSDTILKDLAEEISNLTTLPEEGFSLLNYVNEKNHVPTPPPTATDEQTPAPMDEENEAKEENVNMEDIDETDQIESTEARDTLPLPTSEQIEKPSTTVEHSSRPPSATLKKADDGAENFLSPSPSPPIDHPSTPHRAHTTNRQTTSQFSITPSFNSSTAPITPVEPTIRVEISEKTKYSFRSTQPPRTRKEPSTFSSEPSSHPTQKQKQPSTVPSEKLHRTPIKKPANDQNIDKRQSLLPNNTTMWSYYGKRDDSVENSKVPAPPSTAIVQETPIDPVESIIKEHRHQFGFYRMVPNRRVLIPHKVTFGEVFGDQSHITVDTRASFPPSLFTKSTMHLTDLNRNRRHLHEVEFVQLLSSLVIRSIQIHKKNDVFIPGSQLSATTSGIDFTDALTVSQMQLHSTSDLLPSGKLPPIDQQRSSSMQTAKMRSDAESRASRAGISLRKARDMEDAMSHLLKPSRDRASVALTPGHSQSPPSIPIVYERNAVTHAWLLEQLLKVQGTPDPQNYIQQISRTYPKFTPLLYSRVPDRLISIIWNDPVMKQLSAIVGRRQEVLNEEFTIKRLSTKQTIPTFDDEHSSNLFDYTATSQLLAMQQYQRDENKKEFLPPVRGTKMHLPRHVLKFGFRELESESPEESLVSLRDESTSKTRRRRIYMHLMMSVNEGVCIRHEIVKSQLRQMLKTDVQSTSYIPLVTRSSACNSLFP